MILARTVIFVIVFFISTGVYVYDRHLASQGQVGPVSQLIDFVRFGKYAEDRGRVSKTAGDDEPVSVHDHLLRLQETYDALYKEREDLSRKRQEILAKLANLNNQLQEEARNYTEILSQEQYQFLEEFPELKEIALQTARAYRTEDPLERTQLLSETEKNLEALFHAAEDDGTSSPENQSVKNHWAAVLQLVAQRNPEQFQNSCGQATPDECLNTNSQQALALIQETFHSDGKALAAEADDLIAIIESLAQEYQITGENYSASEHLLEQKNQRIKGDLQNLSTKLVAVTDISVEEIGTLYSDLLFEYDMILDNLAFNLKRIEERQGMLEWQLNHAASLALEQSAESPEEVLSPLAAIRKKQAELLRLLEQNLLAVDQTYQHQRELGGGLALIIKEARRTSAQWVRSEAVSPGLSVSSNRRNRNEGVLDNAFSNRPGAGRTHSSIGRDGGRTSTSLNRNRDTLDRAFSSSSAGRASQQSNYSVRDTRALLDNAAATNKDITERAREQMRRLRDKARDQGFYDRAFPSNLR